MTILRRFAMVVALAVAGLAGISTAAFADPAGQTTPQLLPALLPPPPPDLTDQVTGPSTSLPAKAAPDRFETLAAAVAAQDAAEADEATRCLATAIYFEAKGEPVDGQLAVAEVVINRAKSGRFPANLCSVVTQRGQFSFVHGGALPTIDAGNRYFRTALAVAKVAMVRAWASSAPRALYFHARRVPASARWVKVAAIGNHIFYR